MGSPHARSAVRRLPVLWVGLVLAALLTGCAVPVHGLNGGPGRSAGRMHVMGRMHAVTACPHGVPASPGVVVSVHLMDPGHGHMRGGAMALMAAPSVVRHGRVTFVATATGRRTHELVVLPLRTARAGDRPMSSRGRVSERGALGEASAPCAEGAGDGLRPGTTGWVTLRLRPGAYELVCNEPHHYARGMHAVLVVR